MPETFNSQTSINVCMCAAHISSTQYVVVDMCCRGEKERITYLRRRLDALDHSQGDNRPRSQ